MSERIGVVLMHRGDPDSPATARAWLSAAYGDPHAYRLPFSSGAQQMVGGLLSFIDAGGLKKKLEAIGGRSAAAPQITTLADQLEQRLNGVEQGTAAARHRVLPGFRWSAPLGQTALETFKKDGIQRIVGISLYPQQCHRFSNTLVRGLESQGRAAELNVSVIDRLTDQPAYHAALKASLDDALQRAPNAFVLFCALSIDKADADAGDPYPEQLIETVERLMANQTAPHRLGWLGDNGPGLSAEFMLARAKEGGATHAILVPLGTTLDELDVLYHLDAVLKPLGKKLGFESVERVGAVAQRPELLEALESTLKGHLERMSALGFTG